MIYTNMQEVNQWMESMPSEIKHEYNRFKRISEILTTDPEPEVGQTPKEIIWTKNKAKLYHYEPNKEKKNNIPILMIYALINKPYILDLTPGSSLIEHLTNKGHDVYLLDWGTPGYEDRHMKFEDYIFDYIPRAIQKVLQKSQAEEITLFGYCMGGTLTSIFMSLYPDLPIRNALFLTSPFDFSDTGLYGSFLNKRYFNLDKLVDTLGLIPHEMIDFGNKMLNPIANFYGPYVTLADRADNETFVANWKLMQKWLNDGVPFPGEAYRQWIRDFYQENKLINDKLYIRGRKVDLSKITANLLVIAAKHDNIAMPNQIKPIIDKVSSKNKTYELLDTGHVSVVTGRRALNITYPLINDWLFEHSK